eukprot:TRINITY_DN12146_c0_g1_i2.p1 TRINITY_DN12146_c0_g1~~TRINITY_DN12146_c0_g1_i2.p1  ORF type:complete len:291 (-),score=54.25 TRINITY_DN12146_c0_g1_i2:95-967(-)
MCIRDSSIVIAVGYFTNKRRKGGPNSSNLARRLSQDSKTGQEDVQNTRDEGQARLTESKVEKKMSIASLDNLVLDERQSTIVIIERENGHLTKNTLSSLLSVVIPELRRRTKLILSNHRNERRQVFNNVAEYITKCLQFMEAQANLNNEVLESICQTYSITLTEYKESFDYFLMMGDQDLLQQAANIKLKLTAIAPTKTPSKAQTIEVITFQNSNLQTEMDKIRTDSRVAMFLIQGPQIAEGLLEARLSDLVFEKYGYEGEDIFESINTNNLQEEPEFQEFSSHLAQVLS